jgi:hypothetical protein
VVESVVVDGCIHENASTDWTHNIHDSRSSLLWLLWKESRWFDCRNGVKFVHKCF